LIRGSQAIPQAGIEQYWTASKCRLDRWGRALRQLAVESSEPGLSARRREPSHVWGLMEEILTGEVLTRVWTAALCACDRWRGADLAGPPARSVLIGHLDMRHRVLTLLVRGRTIDAELAVKLNCLRRRSERWTDVLVGRLAGLYDIAEFAFDPERARDFGEELQSQRGQEGGRHAWPLLLGSLRAAFRRGLCPISPNADLNAGIAAGVIGCFPPEVFDSAGVFRSFWLERLATITNDAQGMIEDLLA